MTPRDPEVELHVLTSDDWPTWRALRLAALTDAPEAFGSRLADWTGAGDTEERWRERLSIPGAHDVVASLDGAPVGMVTGVPTGDAGVAELISLWVAPPARGHGVADALLAEAVRWAAQRGARTVRLGVAEDNAAATALYVRHGFRHTGEVSGSMSDGVRRELVMAVRLTRPA